MRPEHKSQLLLGVTRSKAKMFEYGVPSEHHIQIKQNPAKLFTITIGMLGDLSAVINRDKQPTESLSELKSNLIFSAHFFDSYIQSKLNEDLDPYLVLLGSASYYLCDLPGSAAVLASRATALQPEDDPYSMGRFLQYLLAPGFFTPPEGSGNKIEGYFFDRYSLIAKDYHRLFLSPPLDRFDFDAIKKRMIQWAKDIRAISYSTGGARQLLFADIISAIITIKIKNSVWECLPQYSGISLNEWHSTIAKEGFIKEFWPAQHLLGHSNVLKGKSAVIQMPTSAGKTKATELILRSSFLAERVSLAIIIAPFRALCHEIKNSLVEAFHNETTKVDELSDALQTDFEIAELLGHQQVLIVTPEKLLYVLRHSPELAAHAGLLVFDEGHQFDSGIRGITYELLLTSLRSMILEETQKVLISAVISNAEAVGEWLNGEPNVVEGRTLIPTFRSIGFASWLDQLGRIEYVDSRNAEQNEFFVPRVIERFTLRRKLREKVDRFFPEQALKPDGKPNPDFGKTVALYLGLKLAPNGSIAIFCGRKSTAAGICEKVVDIIERGVPLALPTDVSDAQEVARLTHLHVENLGADAPASRSAAHGIFSHHGNTPHGIRLAVEHAMREGLVRFVICTSTLAQGVNLPIRYLIVTNVYQGKERIKVRDFHNLIGRAGRAGMHTEGSILFADPVIYDNRKSFNDKWRWDQVKELLEPGNSEPCVSNLLSIFDPIRSDDKKYIITMEAMDFAKAYIDDPDEVGKLAAEIAAQHGDKNFTRDGVERQVAWRISLISAIESFLLSHWDETESGLSDADVAHLAEGTLAFFLADEQKKEYIRKLFQLLATNIAVNITDPARRTSYGRTLYGVQDAQAIEKWVQANVNGLIATVDETDVLDLVWPLLTQQIKNGVFTKFDTSEVLKEIAHEWISGKPFSDLLKIIRKRKAKMIWGTRRRDFKIDHVVEVCEGVLAYDGALVLSAVCEFIESLNQDDTVEVISRLQLLQKRLKYGVPTESTVALYEIGFSDRVISQELAQSLSISSSQKAGVTKEIKAKKVEATALIAKYPMHFQYRMFSLFD